MHRHTCRYCNEHRAHPPLLGNKEGAIEQCCPHHCHRHDLNAQRQCLVFPEIPDICAQVLVGHEPVIQSLRAAHIHCCREQQERRCWQHRQENAHNAQHQRHATQKCEKELHCLKLPARRYKKISYTGNDCKGSEYFSFKKMFFIIFFVHCTR